MYLLGFIHTTIQYPGYCLSINEEHGISSSLKVWSTNVLNNLVGGPMGGPGPRAGQAGSPFERLAEPLAWEGMLLLGVGPPRARPGRASDMRPVVEPLHEAVQQAAFWG